MRLPENMDTKKADIEKTGPDNKPPRITELDRLLFEFKKNKLKSKRSPGSEGPSEE